ERERQMTTRRVLDTVSIEDLAAATGSEDRLQRAAAQGTSDDRQHELSTEQLSAVFGGVDPDPVDTQQRLAAASQHDRDGTPEIGRALREGIAWGDRAGEIIAQNPGRPWADGFRGATPGQLRDYAASEIRLEGTPMY